MFRRKRLCPHDVEIVHASRQALVKFNESLALNKNLRERIDTLRRERVVFDSIYKKLERELHEKKKVTQTQGTSVRRIENTRRAPYQHTSKYFVFLGGVCAMFLMFCRIVVQQHVGYHVTTRISLCEMQAAPIT